MDNCMENEPINIEKEAAAEEQEDVDNNVTDSAAVAEEAGNEFVADAVDQDCSIGAGEQIHESEGQAESMDNAIHQAAEWIAYAQSLGGACENVIEKVNKIARIRAKFGSLFNLEVSQSTISKLRADNEKGARELAVFSAENDCLKATVQQLRTELWKASEHSRPLADVQAQHKDNASAETNAASEASTTLGKQQKENVSSQHISHISNAAAPVEVVGGKEEDNTLGQKEGVADMGTDENKGSQQAADGDDEEAKEDRPCAVCGLPPKHEVEAKLRALEEAAVSKDDLNAQCIDLRKEVSRKDGIIKDLEQRLDEKSRSESSLIQALEKETQAKQSLGIREQELESNLDQATSQVQDLMSEIEKKVNEVSEHSDCLEDLQSCLVKRGGELPAGAGVVNGTGSQEADIIVINETDEEKKEEDSLLSSSSSSSDGDY